MTPRWKRTVAVLAVGASLLIGSVAHAANGTSLAVVTDVGATSCSSDAAAAIVQIHAAVTSTASAAPADVLVSTDGGITFTNLGTVATWTHQGRTKTAEETIEVTVAANTATPVEVCFVQPGANGNPLKKACSSLTLAPECGSGPQPFCTYNPGCTSSAQCGGGAAFCLLCDESPVGICVNLEFCGGSTPACNSGA